MSASSDTPPASGSAGQAVRWTIVVSAVLMAVLDNTIVNVALPQIQATFGITNDQTVWILTSDIVASVVVMPRTGFFVRIVGRRRLITSAIAAFALTMISGEFKSDDTKRINVDWIGLVLMVGAIGCLELMLDLGRAATGSPRT